jgi:hypothetical protein
MRGRSFVASSLKTLSRRGDKTVLPISKLGRSRTVYLKWAIGLIGFGLVAWVLYGRFRSLLHLGYLDSAFVSVRALAADEARFAGAHPEIGYTCTLSELGNDQLITALTKSGDWNGYAFELTGCSGLNGVGPNRTYKIAARPLVKGYPVLCTDQSGILKTDDEGSVERCLVSRTVP